MATDNQVALTRAPRLPPSNLPKSTRQAVPAFLQKLYEMVNDKNTDDVICWSEAGDSFFVLDQERLSHEVLGRWFKHKNFSSFVRQLNMYGFHKIPHLQQGVLRSETETELWNFINPNFHRGQPDLLCFISRKKQTAQLPDDLPAADTPESTTVPTSTTTTQNQGQVFDVNSFMQSIAAIKRHQTAISSELNELKRSNQLLWQDALAARARHQKQQDTIGRILKFLAGVFGNHAAGNHHKDEVVVNSPSSNHHAVVPRRRTRLMIEGAQHEPSGKVGIIQVEDPEANIIDSSTFSNTASYPYPTIETPVSVPSPAPSIAPSDSASPNITEASYFGSTNASPLFTPQSVPEEATHSPESTFQPPHHNDNPSIATSAAATPTTAAPSPNNALERAATPNRSPTYEIDPRVQHLLNNLSPDQLAHLVNSLSQPDADYTQDLTQNVTDPSHPWFDYGQPLPPSQPPPQPPPSSHAAASPPPPSSSSLPFPFLPLAAPPPSSSSSVEDGLVAFDGLHMDPSAFSHKLDRNWQAAEDIDKDVNAMNTQIHHFIESMGLNPSLFHVDESTATSDPASMTAAAVVGDKNNNDNSGNNPLTSSGGGGGISGISDADTGHDFDFASFLNTLDSGHGMGVGNGVGMGMDLDYNDSVSTAFLDEVPSPSDGTASPVAFVQRPLTPMQGAAATAAAAKANSNAGTPTTTTTSGAGRKRKSDVVMSEFDDGAGRVDEVVAGKTKRRKD